MRRRQFLTTTGLAVAACGLPTVAAQDDEIPNPNAYLTNRQLYQQLRLLNRSDLVDLRRIGRSAGLGDPLWEVTVGEGETNVHLITQIHGDEPAGTDAIVKLLGQMVAEPDRYEDVLANLTITVVPRVNPDGAMFGWDADEDGDEDRITRRQNTQPWDDRDSRYEPYYHYAESGTDDLPAPDPPSGYDMNRDFNIRTDLGGGPGEGDGSENGKGKGNGMGKGQTNGNAPAEYLPEEWWTGYEDDGETRYRLDMPYEGYTLQASGLRLAPEVRAVTESFLRADPDYAITHHHQGIPSVPDTDPLEPSIMSVMAAFGPDYLEQAPFYDGESPVEDNVNPFIDQATSDRSLRLNRLVADRLAEETGPWDEFDTVTRYGYTTLWGSYLDSLCPQTNAAGMLYEISGQSDAVGSRAYGLKVEASRVGFEETFLELATDPELSSVDAGSYFDLPLAGDDYPVDDPEGTGRAAARGRFRSRATAPVRDDYARQV
ncbi:M14 family zinc carboxypeptidase [Halomarina rubra]|uniref:M14 family zinc carboxypeptidase n=1 Tax=Halomarina rubra TaxID=2071873 RepID=A0ABD6AWG0_9EURY|nr:M14 family zinc carboxypeptidase [Halomarina rubra]